MIEVLQEFFDALRDFGLEYFKRYYASYRGFVYSTEDPENVGRLQLTIPQIYGEDPFKYWAKPKGIFSGNKIGSFVIPNVGDGVWVEFENGDPQYPIWSYGWWADGEVPDGASPSVKVFQTTSGHRVEFNDDTNSIEIKQGTKSWNVVLNEIGISLVADKIALGTIDTSKEAAVLGDTAVAKLEEVIDSISDICEAIGKLTVPTALGPSGVPVNKASFVTIKTALSTVKNKLSEMLSKKVTLD
jgi:hypothetical protein